MILQLTIVALLVACSSCYLLWRGWRLVLGRSGGCGGSCGCPTKAPGSADSAPPTTLISLNAERLRRNSANSSSNS
jgi:hypothetical protein